jgi:hypothetical protein
VAEVELLVLLVGLALVWPAAHLVVHLFLRRRRRAEVVDALQVKLMAWERFVDREHHPVRSQDEVRLLNGARRPLRDVVVRAQGAHTGVRSVRHPEVAVGARVVVPLPSAGDELRAVARFSIGRSRWRLDERGNLTRRR